MLYTSNMVNISKRIETGQTLFFANEIKAMETARKMRSYHYQVFDTKNKHAGYAVPK